MSQEQVEILRRVYEAGNRGDWDEALRHVHPDVEVVFQAGPNAGKHRGHEEAKAVLSDLTAAFDAWIMEPVELFEDRDQVVVIVNNRLRPKGGTGGEFAYRNGHIWTIRDGIILSLVGYPNPEEALEAAGLRV